MKLPPVKRRYEFIQQLAAERDSFDEEAKQAWLENASLVTQIQDLRTSISAADAHTADVMRSHTVRIAALTAELTEERMARARFDTELNALKRALATETEEHRLAAQRLAEEAGLKEEAERELLESTIMLEDYLQQLVDLTERSHNSQNAMASLETEQRRLEAQILELREQIVRERAEAERGRATAEATHARDRANSEVANAKNEELHAREAEALRTEISALQNEVGTLQDQVEGLRGENTGLENRLAETLREMEQEKVLRAKEARISRQSNVVLDGRLAEQEAAILGQEGRLKSLSGDLDGARSELANALAQLAEREQDLLSVQNAYASLTRAEADRALDELTEPRGGKANKRKAQPAVSAAALAKRTAAVGQLKTLAGNAQPGSARSLFNALGAALQPDMVCDIGAGESIGAHFRAAFKQAEFVIFEPSRPKLQALENSDEGDGDARFEPLAVADLDGEANYYEAGPGEGGLRRRLDQASPRASKVKAVTLDHYFADRLAERPRFMLWIEAESAPDKVLKGAREVLQTTLAVRLKANHQSVWKNDVLAPAMIELMQDAGFILMGEDPAAQIIAKGKAVPSEMIFLNSRWLELISAAGDNAPDAGKAEGEAASQT